MRWVPRRELWWRLAWTSWGIGTARLTLLPGGWLSPLSCLINLVTSFIQVVLDNCVIGELSLVSLLYSIYSIPELYVTTTLRD